MAVRILDKNGNIKTITTTVVTGETDPIWLADKLDYLTILSASATYSVLGHTHTFASLTSKPTTIAGYGITDYNSLWDTRLALKTTTNLAEGTNLYFTDGRAVTALTGENISLFTNDSGYLTSLSGAVLIGRNLTINGTMQDLSADRTWTISTISGNAGTATTLATPRLINGVSFNGSADISTDTYLKAIQAMGSTIVAQNIDGTLADASGAISVATGRVYFVAVYLPVATTITGFKWKQSVTGNYTANNYNGGGLYTYSGGTLTLVASSTNDGDIWKATVNTIGSKAFSSTYSAAAGLYFVAVTYSASSAVVIPSLGSLMATSSVNIVNDFTNSAKSSGFISSLTALPSPTQAMSGITATGGEIWMGLY